MNFTGLTSPVIKRKEQEDASAPSKAIALHKKAARHLEEAAKLHLEAAKYHEKGERDRANKIALKAQDHVALAIEAQKKDQKLQASL